MPYVSNLHVTAVEREKQLVLLYEVRSGICDQSFGIHVAKLAHFPAAVIQAAKRKAEQLEYLKLNPKKLKGEEESSEATSALQQEETTKQKLVLFLKKFSSLPLDSLPKEQALAKIAQLKKEIFEGETSSLDLLLSKLT